MLKKLPHIVIFLSVLLCTLYTRQVRWARSPDWTVLINSDGYGYVAFLPTFIIHHNTDFKKSLMDVQKVRPGSVGQLWNIYDYDEKHQMDKYFVGVSLLILPFFLIGILWAKIRGYDVDGFSYPFQVCTSIAALFYLLVGLYFLYKLLKAFNINGVLISILLVAVVFATNLINYVTIEPSMSHGYTFSMAAMFLYFTKKWIDSGQNKAIIGAAATLGLMVIIRPPNGLIILLVPFLTGSLKGTGILIKNAMRSKQLIIAAIVSSAIIGIQLLTLKVETGHWFVWTYKGEGFDFFKPHFFDILFSYQKGWFIYTPLMFFMLLVALTVFAIKDRSRFLYLLLFVLLIVYIDSSWSDWTYGGSFGSRPFVDYYPFFILAFALATNTLLSWWFKVPLILIGLLCMSLNLIQFYQIERFILPQAGMDKEKYWRIFLQTSDDFMGFFDHMNGEQDYKTFDGYTATNNFENNTWGSNDNITCAYAHSATHSAFANETLSHIPRFADTVGKLPRIKDGTLTALISFWMYEPDRNNASTLAIMIVGDNKSPYFWTGINLTRLPEGCNKWCKVERIVNLPEFKNKNDILSVDIMNPKGIIYIDDEEIKFGVLK